MAYIILLKACDLQREKEKFRNPKAGRPAQAGKRLLVGPSTCPPSALPGQSRRAEAAPLTSWQEWRPLLRTLSHQWGRSLQRAGHGIGAFHLLGHSGTAPRGLILHPGGGSLLAKVIVWTEGTASPRGGAGGAIMAGTNQGDRVLFWRFSASHGGAGGANPPSQSLDLALHYATKGTELTRAASAAPARPQWVWWVLLAPAPLHCLSLGTQAGRAGVCEGDYSAFPLSPFHLLDKALAAGKPQPIRHRSSYRSGH